MGVHISTKSKKKASLKLLNQINSYLFEQEYDEYKGNSEVKIALNNAVKTLSNLIKNG